MSISILGIFVADLVFFGEKIPVEGETILGKNFVIGFLVKILLLVLVAKDQTKL